MVIVASLVTVVPCCYVVYCWSLVTIVDWLLDVKLVMLASGAVLAFIGIGIALGNKAWLVIVLLALGVLWDVVAMLITADLTFGHFR